MTGGREWQPGDVIGPLSVAPVSRTTLALFAGGSGDHNEIHLDSDVARAAGFDDVFAQGMLSMAYLSRLLTDTFGQAAIEAFSARFTAITPIGAEPVCSGVVTKMDGRTVELDLRVDVGPETPTIVGTARVRV